MSAAFKMEGLALLTPEQITQIVRAAVREELATKTEPPMLDMKASAEFLGINVNTLQKRIARGLIEPDLPGGRDGRKGHRFSLETLRRYRDGK